MSSTQLFALDLWFLALPIAVVNIRWMRATNHSDGTECASCCDAFRKSWFPSLFDLSVSLSSGWIEIVGQCGRTHFVGFVWSEKVSIKQYQIKTSIQIRRRSHIPLLMG